MGEGISRYNGGLPSYKPKGGHETSQKSSNVDWIRKGKETKGKLTSFSSAIFANTLIELSGSIEAAERRVS